MKKGENKGYYFPVISEQRTFFNHPENAKNALNLLNSGYSFKYIAKIFHCSPSTVKSFKAKQKKLGAYVREVKRYVRKKVEKEIVSDDEYSKQYSYTKTFQKKENREVATRMLNEGYTFKEIGKELDCHHTSVIYFYQGEVKKGVKFRNRKKSRYSLLTKRKKESLKNIPKWKDLSIEKFEKINSGKKSYLDYLREYKNKNRQAEEERMEKARETVLNARKLRKERFSSLVEKEQDLSS